MYISVIDMIIPKMLGRMPQGSLIAFHKAKFLPSIQICQPNEYLKTIKIENIVSLFKIRHILLRITQKGVRV